MSGSGLARALAGSAARLLLFMLFMLVGVKPPGIDAPGCGDCSSRLTPDPSMIELAGEPPASGVSASGCTCMWLPAEAFDIVELSGMTSWDVDRELRGRPSVLRVLWADRHHKGTITITVRGGP